MSGEHGARSTERADDGAAGHGIAEEIMAEQSHVDLAYRRLDEARELAGQRLDEVRRTSGGTPAARSERDAFAMLYEDRLVSLRAVEDRLVFGRMDSRPIVADDQDQDQDRDQDHDHGQDHGQDGGLGPDRLETLYIGRTGLSDDRQRTLLTDWRAPAVEPFYRATAADPGRVVRRRHLSLRGRRVTALEDDVLTTDGLDGGAVVAGGGALMAAVDAARTGQMRDIVATLQAEQDEVVRAPMNQVLVVQGGPGTGKTAVALHRAAYLLYAHRDRIARSGVLIVGPNAAFLRYIDQVLPSLGETGVVMSTLGGLYPGVRATTSDGDEAARLKGEVRSAALVAAAVRLRQRIPARPVRVDVGGVGPQGSRQLQLRPAAVRAARDAARATGADHNTARTTFVKRLLSELVRQTAAASGVRREDLDPEVRRDIEGELRESVAVRREINLLWMPLDPVGVLTDLWARPERLAAAARLAEERHPGRGRAPVTPWSDAELASLHRERGAALTVDDVPLLDELAEVVGDPVSRSGADAAARADAERRSRLAYAGAVIESHATDDTESLEGMAAGLMDAEDLADRWDVGGVGATVAERAAADRSWTYGHVVVDEAQELSAMAWRVLARRCPSRSMTVVGDLAQTSSVAGAVRGGGWEEALSPVLAGTTGSGLDLGRPWHLAQLTVNYRTPRQVMDLAGAALRAAGVDAPVPSSVRDATTEPVAVTAPGPVGGECWTAEVVDAAAAALARRGEGTVAVVCPPGLRPHLARALRGDPRTADAAAPTTRSGPTTSAVHLTDVAGVKGLEFDEVVLVEPATIVAAGSRGINDLYVAMTRPTQRLVVVTSQPLPAGLEALRPEVPPAG